MEVSRRGIIDALRSPVIDRGVYLNLCYFQPRSDLNPDHRNLYSSNRFTVVRQLHYSNQNENSIDMVLFLNGLPLITMELKNQLTGQNVVHSENQYRNDRHPREPLLKFKRCVVHFCVDNNKVSMTTRLAGSKTTFLPFNRGLYQSTMLEGETDPNRLYDLQGDIYQFQLYTKEDINQFCEVFYDRDRDEGSLHSMLDKAVDNFNRIEDEEIREDFRSKIQSWIRMYGYLSRIIKHQTLGL